MRRSAPSREEVGLIPAPGTTLPLRDARGPVERVTFHNPDNGFCVLRVKARGQRDLVTVVGHAPTISAGEFIQASGTWVNDRRPRTPVQGELPACGATHHGRRYREYLGSGMIGG